jgi:hypothetical protein
MIPTDSIQWDADDRLAADLHCVSCGYNLRGLKRTGVCGECGVPIKWTLEGSYLHAHDPAWVDRPRSGVACLALTLPWLWLPPAWIIYGIGLWRATTPDPASQRGGGLLRVTVVRFLFAALPPIFAGGLTTMCVAYSSTAWSPTSALWDAMLILTVAAVPLVPLITGAAIRRVAVWSDSTPLKGRHGTGLWLSGLSAVFLAGWGLNEIASLQLDILVALGAVGVPLGLCGFGCCVASIVGVLRTLDRAELHARALRTQMRYWQRPLPGASRTAKR